MSKIEKLIKKFFEKPVRNDMTMDEIIKLSRYYGCEIVTGGNHQIKIVHRATGTIIPMPQHGKNVKEVYVVELRQLFDVIISKKG